MTCTKSFKSLGLFDNVLTYLNTSLIWSTFSFFCFLFLYFYLIFLFLFFVIWIHSPFLFSKAHMSLHISLRRFMSLCFVRVFHSSGVVLQRAAEEEWRNGLYLVCTTREERPYATHSMRAIVCTMILSFLWNLLFDSISVSIIQKASSLLQYPIIISDVLYSDSYVFLFLLYSFFFAFACDEEKNFLLLI